MFACFLSIEGISQFVQMKRFEKPQIQEYLNLVTYRFKLV